MLCVLLMQLSHLPCFCELLISEYREFLNLVLAAGLFLYSRLEWQSIALILHPVISFCSSSIARSLLGGGKFCNFFLRLQMKPRTYINLPFSENGKHCPGIFPTTYNNNPKGVKPASYLSLVNGWYIILVGRCNTKMIANHCFQLMLVEVINLDRLQICKAQAVII